GDEGVAARQAVRADGGATRLVGDPALLRAGDQVVDQHAHASTRTRSERPQRVHQVVDTTERLDHHALDPEIVTPDLLDQLGVVASLDEDPTLTGHPRALSRDGHRAGRRTPWRGWRGAGDRGREYHRPPLEEEARAQREGAPLAATVLQRERAEVAVDGHDLAAPVGHDLLDHQPARRLGGRRTAAG